MSRRHVAGLPFPHDVAHRSRLLHTVVESGHGETATEAAYRLGQGLTAEGEHGPAVEWYLTAADATAPPPSASTAGCSRPARRRPSCWPRPGARSGPAGSESALPRSAR